MNAHLKGGLIIVNQRIDLVQKQIDTLWQLAQLGCEWKYEGLCVTSVQYQNFTRAANLSKEMSQLLLGNWSADFEAKMMELRASIVQINSSRVDLSLAEGLTTWIAAAMNHLKEWAGIGSLAILLALAALVGIYCICKMRADLMRSHAMIIQAFTAIEAGQSPQAWIAAIKQ